mgnify:CR=1 FL=1
MDGEINELRAEIDRLLAVAETTRLETERVQQLHDEQLAARGLEADQLREALATRDLIGQAKGILMAATRCTADEAFALLAKQSQAQNRKLVEIAIELVARAPRRGTPAG